MTNDWGPELPPSHTLRSCARHWFVLCTPGLVYSLLPIEAKRMFP